MAGPTNPEEVPSGGAGIAEHLRTLAESVAAYFHARLELAGMESKEAFAHCLKILVWLSVAATAAFLGYLFLCGALIFLIAALFHLSRAWVMLGFGLAHLVIGAACAATLWKKFSHPLFGATLNEFKKDQEWLKTRTKPN